MTEEAAPELDISEATSYHEILAMVVPGRVRCGVSGREMQGICQAAMQGGEALSSLLELVLVHAVFFGRMRPNDKAKVTHTSKSPACVPWELLPFLIFSYCSLFPSRCVPWARRWDSWRRGGHTVMDGPCMAGLGYTTMYIGDGANDTCALKA